MPTLADYQASIPKCPGVTTQAGVTPAPCMQPLTWDNEREVWTCPKHGERWAVLTILQALSEPERREVR